MDRNKQTAQADPASCLDQQAEALAARHQEQLVAMTNRALAQATPPQKRRSRRTAGAMAGLAFTLIVAATVVLFKPATEQPTQVAKVQPTLIPDWVEDDTVPVSLLENMDLYVWIAHQATTENQG